MNNLFGVRILHKVERGNKKGKEIRTEKRGKEMKESTGKWKVPKGRKKS